MLEMIETEVLGLVISYESESEASQVRGIHQKCLTGVI
jgi:hypothetical protein